MGRSVSYLNNSLHEIYFDCSKFEEFDFQDTIDNIRGEFEAAFPSLNECNKWQGNEDHIILENSFCIIAISEYCGLACVSIAVDPCIDEYDTRYRTSLAENWINKCWPKMQKIIGELTGTTFVKQGSFSNGEGIFAKSTGGGE